MRTTLVLRLVFTAGKVACLPHHTDVVPRCFMLPQITLVLRLVFTAGEVAFLPHYADVVPRYHHPGPGATRLGTISKQCRRT